MVELHLYTVTVTGSSPVVPILLHMHITAIVPVFNEVRMLPFFLDYYTTFCDYIVVYDGSSTDGSRDVVVDYMNRGLGCEIELRVNRTVGTLDVYNESYAKCPNLSLHYVRTHGWRSLFAAIEGIMEWVLVVDCDEFVWHPDGVRNKLASYRAQGISFPSPSNIQMMAKSFPTYTGQKLVDTVTQGYIDWSVEGVKRLAFDTSIKKNYNFKEFGYIVAGENTYDCEPIIDRLKVLHYPKLGFDFYKERTKTKGHRLSEDNKKFGLSYHYAKEMDTTEADFEALFSHRGFVSNIHDPLAYPSFSPFPHEVRVRPTNSVFIN